MSVIGFDPGFGNSKGAYINGQLNTTHLSSVVGIGNTELGLLNAVSSSTRFMRKGRQDIPLRGSFEEVTYLVGENVANFARPVERMDFMRLGSGPELKALFYATMYNLLGEGVHGDIRLMVGLPVEVMLNRELALSTRRQLRNWMVGRHQFFVDDLGIVLDIRRVEVIAQPAGAYFSWGMNEEGKWVKPAEDLKQMLAVCDIGFNTVDLFVLQGGQPVARYTDGENLGMRRAAEILVNHIRKTANVTLSLHGADRLMRMRDPQLSTVDGMISLAAVSQQAYESVTAGVVQFVERSWGNARQFRRVLFTGGGAEALRSQLARHYPHGVVLPSAVTANAAGLAKYGKRALAK